MLGTLEHELRHDHQYNVVSTTRCPSDGEWEASPDGRQWLAATTADREAGRLAVRIDDPEHYYWTNLKESEAEFYTYWIRARWPRPQGTAEMAGIEKLCWQGESQRCKYMEERRGRRPSSYPED